MQSHGSSRGAPLWKREGGSSAGGEEQACRAVPGLSSKHRRSSSRRGRWQPAGPCSGHRGSTELVKEGTRTGTVLGKEGAQGQARDWVQSPALAGWWGSGHGSALLRGSHHLLSLQKGLGRPDPRTQSWAQSRAASWVPSSAGETRLPGRRESRSASPPSHLGSRAGTRGRCETRSGPRPARAPGRSPHPGQICTPR